jgi:hypothetical protein
MSFNEISKIGVLAQVGTDEKRTQEKGVSLLCYMSSYIKSLVPRTSVCHDFRSLVDRTFFQFLVTAV